MLTKKKKELMSSETVEEQKNDKSERPEKCVKLMKLKIGEQDPATNSLVSMEMQDTIRTGFRRSGSGNYNRRNTVSGGASSRRKKSIDNIFSKIEPTYIEEVNKSKLKGLPRRSLANDLDLAAFRNAQNLESDDEDNEENKKDDSVVKMLDLKIGEQDPTTNSLVALEMQDTQKIGFRHKPIRKKSIDRIFQKVKKVHIVHKFDKTPLKGIPRRSLASNLDPAILRGDILESDDDDLDENIENPSHLVNDNKSRQPAKGRRFIDENDVVEDTGEDFIKRTSQEKMRRRVSFTPFAKSSMRSTSRVKSSFSKNDDDDYDDDQEEKDESKQKDNNDDDSGVVKVLNLNIGEKDPHSETLVALEMQDTKRTGFSNKNKSMSRRRKKSIDKIFEGINSVNVESGLEPAKMKIVKRRSLAADFDIAKFVANDESESD